jgi:O-antigen/teichoic acid export membrane protein
LENVPDRMTGLSAARGSILLSASSYLGIAIRLATVVIVTRELGAHDYGVYVLTLSVQLAISSGYYLGAGRAVIADISRQIGQKQFGRVRRLLTEYSALQLTLAVILGGGVALFIPVFSGGLLNDSASDWLGLIAILVAMAALGRIVSTGLTSHGNFSALAARKLVEVIGRLVAALVLVSFLHRGIGGVLEADIIAQGAGLLVSFFFLARSTSYLRFHTPHRSWVLPGILKAHGKWDILTSVGSQLTESGANWVTAGILNAEAVGILALAKRSMGFAKSGLPLKTVLTPLMARRVSDPAQVRRIFSKAIQYRVQLNILMVIVGGALAYPVFRLLFPDFFPLVLPVFLLLLLRYFLNAYNVVTNPLVEAMQAQRISFSMIVVRRISYFALSPALMIGLGVIGAALEAVIATVIMSLVKYRLIARLGLGLRIEISSFFRFDAEDRNLIKRILPGRLRKLGLNRR